jgi:zinc resistance-associated protein
MNNKTNTTKKMALAAILIGTIAAAGLQNAIANPGKNTNATAPVGHHMMTVDQEKIDPALIKARTKYLDETVAVRKEIVEKRAELRVLMRSDNPDSKAVGKLSGELFDLNEQLRNKAKETGLETYGGFGMMGAGMGYGMGYGHGMGIGHGPRSHWNAKPWCLSADDDEN